ncbi:hypothetical protein EKL97_14355 [Flavobacterium sp. LS1P28]|uniref:chromate resistance protein ChrB domain-containing protein n=1 Tax=unclassified Flavobacterium TaxID=196869 RepID=UPI000F8472DB|nr:MULTISPECIES: chromate resistance protein ChrB domain-containing protein [unclassified Flavobacterium]RTY73663.1 hypothetical protein EKL96_10010 [Flavobacterium sp. LS1R10]RTY78222.1 hypothetical protein EKL97_14355 [Flavobacterium sp. LS1P28]RTY90489.1 hypothetical protein EKM01_11220 [Flavobacterium sp. RSP46]
MKWITRERPKIDRIASPWLIKTFIDKNAEIIYKLLFLQILHKMVRKQFLIAHKKLHYF